jgi:hypothetical protein
MLEQFFNEHHIVRTVRRGLAAASGFPLPSERVSSLLRFQPTVQTMPNFCQRSSMTSNRSRRPRLVAVR